MANCGSLQRPPPPNTHNGSEILIALAKCVFNKLCNEWAQFILCEFAPFFTCYLVFTHFSNIEFQIILDSKITRIMKKRVNGIPNIQPTSRLLVQLPDPET